MYLHDDILNPLDQTFSLPIPNLDLPVFCTESGDSMLQGPFLQDEIDHAAVESKLNFFHALNFLRCPFRKPGNDRTDTSPDMIKSGIFVPESCENTHVLWLVYTDKIGSAQPSKIQTLAQDLDRLRDHPRVASQALVLLMLKRVCDCDTNDLDHIIFYKRQWYPLGLDRRSDHARELSSWWRNWFDIDADTWHVFTQYLRQSPIALACLESMKLWEERLAELEQKPHPVWTAMQTDLVQHVFVDQLTAYYESPSALRINWPLRSGHLVKFRLESNTWISGIALGLGPKRVYENQFHATLDPIWLVDGDLYREIKPLERARRTLSLPQQRCDIIRVRSCDVRPMNDMEFSNEDQTLTDFDRAVQNANFSLREISTQSFSHGDLVFVYDSDVHGHNINFPGTYEFHGLDSATVMDIGIVLDCESKDPDCRTLYSWREQRLRTIACSKLFWAPESQFGRALVVPSQVLDQHAPCAVLRHLDLEFQFNKVYVF
jgi:hypothetical protein